MATAPYTVLTVVESEKTGDRYEIRLSHQTGVTYCSCKGWGFRKTCKHLDAYNAAPTINVSGLQKSTTSPQALAPKGSAADLLRSELGKLGVSINTSMAAAIVGKLRAHLAAQGRAIKAASADVPMPEQTFNAAGVRVIKLPD